MGVLSNIAVDSTVGNIVRFSDQKKGIHITRFVTVKIS